MLPQKHNKQIITFGIIEIENRKSDCHKYPTAVADIDKMLTFHRVLNEPPLLNMSGLRIWQSCEYADVTQIMGYAEYA